METVGKVLILSLSAGGGPVFSNWLSSFKRYRPEFKACRVSFDLLDICVQRLVLRLNLFTIHCDLDLQVYDLR